MATRKSLSDVIQRDHYAYDVNKNVLTGGELYDEEALKQSLEMIVSTLVGERIFSQFGSTVTLQLFRNFSPSRSNDILNSIAAAVRQWDSRIKINEPNMRLFYDSTNPNEFILFIPFTIVPQQINSVFQKKIIL